MATEAAPMICMSANGNTTSHSDKAALRMLVATASAVLDFRRDDVNSEWKLVRDDILKGHHVSALSYDERSGLLWAALHFQGGLLVSADGGETWESRNNGLESEHVYTILIQHVGDDTILNVGTEPVMFYRSFDMGQSWQKYPGCLDVEEKEKWLFPRSVPHIKHIASPPSKPDLLYICVEQGDLLKSVDGGKSWYTVAGDIDQPDDKFRRDMHRVTFHYENEDEIFLTSGIGLYHSTDAGESWEMYTDIHFRMGYPDPFFIDPYDPNRMYMIGAGVSPNPNWGKAGTAHPLALVSTDRGVNWDDAMNGIETPLCGNIETAAMHVSEEGGLELFMGTSCGEFFTSRDRAESWSHVAKGIPAMSKGPHFRHFLSAEDRAAYEEGLKDYEEKVIAEWAQIV